LPADRCDVSILAMRVNVWLALVSVAFIAQHLMAAPADGAPRDTAPVSEAVDEHPAIVTDTPSGRLASPEIVNVRVYQSPEVTVEALRAALTVAEATFAAASIGVVWRVCGPAECNTPPAPTERLVRLVRAPQGGNLDTRCLGDALIDPLNGTGVLATVYVDRVLGLARHLDIDHRTLLGRTIAHEIGHLLLATNTHGTSGLMREIWSPEELLASRADDWFLHPLEAAAIRQRLTVSRADDLSNTL
jgi:hypothetical protein